MAKSAGKITSPHHAIAEEHLDRPVSAQSDISLRNQSIARNLYQQSEVAAFFEGDHCKYWAGITIR